MQNPAVGICSKEEFNSILVCEKERADRNRHGFSIVIIETQDSAATSALMEYFMHRVRATDVIGWLGTRNLGVLLYNTPAGGAWQFIENHQKFMNDDSPLSKCTVYSYPNEWCGT